MEEQTIKQHSNGNFIPENYPEHSRSTAQYPAFEKRSGRIFPQDPAAVIKCNHLHSKNYIFRASDIKARLSNEDLSQYLVMGWLSEKQQGTWTVLSI